MPSLGEYQWGSEPNIYATFSYEYQRSGPDMQYRITTTLRMPSGWYGFEIYEDIVLAGSTKVSGYRLKGASGSPDGISYTTGWLTVSNKTSGSTAASFRIYAGSGSSRDETYSFNLAISPAQSRINTYPAFYIGANFKISTTKYNSAYVDTLDLYINNIKVLTRSNFQPNQYLNPTQAENAAMYAAMPNSNRAPSQFVLTTRTSSGTYIGEDSKSDYANVENSNPTAPGVSVADINAATLALTGDAQTAIRGYSNLQVTITTQSKAVNAATLKNYIVTCGAKQATITPPATTVTITGAQAATITVSAVDSRGNQTSANASVKLIPYTPITITEGNAVRDNISDQPARLSYQGLIYPGSFGAVSNNILSAIYRYKVTSEGGDKYVEETSVDIMPMVADNGSFSLAPKYIYGDLLAEGFTATSSFDLDVMVTDRLTSAVYHIQLPAGIPGTYLKRSGNEYAFGVGMIPTISRGLQVDGIAVYQRDFIRVNLTGNKTINKPSGYGGEQIPFDQVFLSGGECLTLTNGKVYCSVPAIIRITANIQVSTIASPYLLLGMDGGYNAVGAFVENGLATNSCTMSDLLEIETGHYVSVLIGAKGSFSNAAIYSQSSLSVEIVQYL